MGATFGRTAIPELDGAENSTTLHDGTVVTYDVYSQDKQNSSLHCHQVRVIILRIRSFMCLFFQSFAHHLCEVVNHIETINWESNELIK